MRLRLSAAYLRSIVQDAISDTIDGHRASREFSDEKYQPPDGEPTEQEITDFIKTNQLLDVETIDFLTKQSLIGFEARLNSVRAAWLEEFRGNVSSWAETETWLAGDMITVEILINPEPINSVIWQPSESILRPIWIEKSPSAIMIAADLLKKGRLLSELHWRDFEKLIAQLLEKSGWLIELMQGSKDGGIDVVATIREPELGLIKSLWQAKKYRPSNKVQVNVVRELAGIRDNHKATKGIIVTTSSLTKGALDWIRQDEFRLGYKDKNDIEEWVLGAS
jgi:restriction system protein